jgi:hypothetical protein
MIRPAGMPGHDASGSNCRSLPVAKSCEKRRCVTRLALAASRCPALPSRARTVLRHIALSQCNLSLPPAFATEQGRAAAVCGRAQRSGPGETMNGTVAQSGHPAGSGLLNWDDAVCIATALLTRRYVLPDIQHHPALAREAQRLAALLCAYGKLSAAINHGQVAADERRQADGQDSRLQHQVRARANDPYAGEFVASPGIERTASETFLGNDRRESS